MKPTSILVLESSSLLARGLFQSLRRDKSLNLIPCEPGREADLMAEISHHQPDIVVIGEDSRLVQNNALQHILMRYPKLKVILISKDKNWLHIFHKEDVLLTNSSDLERVIRSM